MSKPICTSCGSRVAAKRRAIAKKILALRELNPLFTMRDVCDVLDDLNRTGRKRKTAHTRRGVSG